MAVVADTRAQTGFYCSTSGTYFTDKESLNEHYKSDFHRYNLKRKVAGLPPVTQEWFEARKAQLAQTSADATSKVWLDPLTKKKFASENTYQAHVKSKKYQELVKKSGQPAPAPVIIFKKAEEPQQQQVPVREQQEKGFVIKPPSRSLAAKQEAAGQADDRRNNMEPSAGSSKLPRDKDADSDEGADEVGDEAGWETASDDEAEQWEEWDLGTSLFDNHKSASMEANLEYMYKKFGFYLPDAEYLRDPQGLLRYLGAKLQYGHVPLYCSGDDPNARQFPSLHAVQRHMVDTNHCKMLYDGNEDEYAEYYDYQDEEAEDNGALVLAGAGAGALGGDGGGFELVVQSGEGSGAGKVLGSREFLKYYRQRHRPQDMRQSVLVNSMLQQYRRLAISTKEEGSDPLEVKQAKKAAKLKERSYLQLFMKSNIIRNLPKNCTH